MSQQSINKERITDSINDNIPNKEKNKINRIDELGDKSNSHINGTTMEHRKSRNASKNKEHKEEDVEVKLKEQEQSLLLEEESSNFNSESLKSYMTNVSTITLTTLDYFPSLIDLNLNDIVNYTDPEPLFDEIGREKYIKLCRNMEIIPITRVLRSLSTKSLDLTYYGLTEKQMHALCDALKSNNNIEELILQDNWLTPQSVHYLNELLVVNISIKILNLRECRIGSQGGECLIEGLMNTQVVEDLDLSFNSLGDDGLKFLENSLIENISIKKLNLSHNNLTEYSGKTLENILLQNKYLEELDLTWNSFNTAWGNKSLGNGLSNNEYITSLNLSWNGISAKQALTPIMKYTKVSTSLKFLDLSNNRLFEGSVKTARTILRKSKSIYEYKLGNNLITPEEAVAFVKIMKRKKNCVQKLDLENITVTKEILKLEIELNKLGKTIIYGRIIGNYAIKGPEFIKVLFGRCNYLAMTPKKKKAKKNFGHFILRLPDEQKNKEEFQNLLKKKKIKKLDEELINQLTWKFMYKGLINYKQMKDAYLRFYPDTILPSSSECKTRKKKKE